MNHQAYIGHQDQFYGIEEVRLVGGKGDGMRLLQIRNGNGMELTISPDRCADITRLSFKGCNIGYFSPCGYVAPAYYDHLDAGFLKSFTAGFLTTCGLTAVGAACEDAGEVLPLHGTIGNTPCQRVWWTEDHDHFYIHAEIDDSRIFAHKLHMSRQYKVSKWDGTFQIEDRIENRGDVETPVMVLYHINFGYPLLSEKAQLEINSCAVEPRNARAAEDLDTWNKILPPTPAFEEQCYFHSFDGEGRAKITNPDLGRSACVSFDSANLEYFTQWKMMGVRDYVMGLEPGNCTPEGRDVVRQKGRLKMLAPGESVSYRVCVTLE